MYIVKTEDSFDSAHFLARYNGKCRNIHGHRWRVVIEIAGENLDDGMVVDFTDIKAALKSLTDNLDHSLVMEKDTLKPQTYECLVDEGFRIMIMDFRPTAENFAKYFFDEIKNKGFNIRAAEVYETPNNCARYEA
ncbi:MAG: 6-carboxytetrahydropterin synthase QueD [Lachnospiraceae bacterium]|nr:6-carboxytetrahydropterin synthase QueD [Lachnospiraceae bacterium]